MQRMSEQDALELIQDLQAQNVRTDVIKTELLSKNFSYGEIRDLIEKAENLLPSQSKEFLYSQTLVDRTPAPEYGGCLTVFMIVFGLGGFILLSILFLDLIGFTAPPSSVGVVRYQRAPMFAYILAFVLGAGTLWSCWQLWDYNKLGYYGLVLMLIILIAFSALIQHIQLGGFFVFMFIWFNWQMRKYRPHFY